MKSQNSFTAYIPIDRQMALFQDMPLPDRMLGTALFADISGFTPFTEALAQEFGPQQGAEELTYLLNQIYSAIIAEVHQYGGSVISISGDAITCWYDQDQGMRALTSAAGIQAVMEQFSTITTRTGAQFSLAIKVSLANGQVRRFLVGSPDRHRIDTLAGRTLEELATGEHLAQRGEIVASASLIAGVDEEVLVSDWRTDERTAFQFGVVQEINHPADPAPWPEIPGGSLDEAAIRPWLLPTIYERLSRGSDQFLADLRPVTALFLSFGGIDYDEDDDAGLLLDAYIRHLQKAIEQYEGALLQLTIGDKGSYVFAAFGAPIAHDDDTMRGLAAAEELLETPPNLSFIGDVRIGIARGLMYAGTFGAPVRRVYGAQGDKANLAARLMQAARPGEILCDEEVYRLARTRWSFDALPAMRVKGKAGLVRVYRSIGKRSTVKVEEASQLFGRLTEISRLEKLLDNLQAGSGSILFVEGEAGIGKSRLIGELIRLMRSRGITGLLGSGHSTEQQTPYRAWQEIFTSFFAVDAVRDPKERLDKVGSVLQEVAPKMIQRLPLLNEVLRIDAPETAVTAALDPSLRQESRVGLLVSLLRAWSNERPLVLVLEDAHWLDSLSWDLAVHVARTLLSTHAPLLLVMVNRPMEENSYGSKTVTKLMSLGKSETLSLNNLNPEELILLSTAQLELEPDGLPESVASLVTKRSDGNPFFAEELLHTLVEQGLIKVKASGKKNVLVMSERFLTAQQILPDTLQGLILSRIDRLPPERQFVLKVAAVIGRTFTYTPLQAALSALMPLTLDGLKSYLKEMTQRSLINLESLEPELSYIFKHIITQEVAYQTLLFNQRKEIHRSIACWYEAEFKTEDRGVVQTDISVYPLLVHHSHHAEDFQRERKYAELAGDQAVRQYANTEAYRYYSRAIELTPDDHVEQKYALLQKRYHVLHNMAKREEQKADLDEMERLIERLDGAGQKMEFLANRALYLLFVGALNQALETAGELVRVAEETGDIAYQANGYIRQGGAYRRLAKYGEARQRLERAVNLAQSISRDDLVSSASRELGIVSDLNGDPNQAFAYFDQDLEIERRRDNRPGIGTALNNCGIVEWRRGNYRKALDLFEQSLAIDKEVGSRYSEGFVLGNLAMVSSDLGDFTKAIAYAEESLEIHREHGNRYGVSRVLGMLGNALIRLGEYEKSLPIHEEGLLITREDGDSQDQIFHLDHLGCASLWTGDYGNARLCYEEAYRLSREVGERNGELTAMKGLAILTNQLDQFGESRQYSQSVTQIARDLDNPDSLATGRLYEGHALYGLGELSEAEAAYQQGLEQTMRSESSAASKSSLVGFEIQAGLARTALARKELDKAVGIVAPILEYLTSDGLDGSENGFLVYLICYEVLSARDDPRAGEVLRAAVEALHKRASRLSEARRQSYIKDVPSHREILRLWEGQQREYEIR
jgi:class 3 adenylate cyclase/tetratricopeptide (TPR) repeat protein